MNQLGQQKKAFFFLLDFELEKSIILSKKELRHSPIWFDINGKRNFRPTARPPIKVNFQKRVISKNIYQQAFQLVQREINKGNSYLLNLTFPTKISTNLNFQELFLWSNAKYKLLLEQELVVFSPETFIKIYNNKIASFPMKGTIAANLPNAATLLLADRKEKAEHVTIVDLIRNDLNRVAEKVRVEQFRYIDYLKNAQKDLLQVSSKIVGDLPKDFPNYIGTILMSLLPAGSISGAPKQKTIEIIKAAEQQKRGYYTGVFGYFDGHNLDSGVLIRYIEQKKHQLYYRSGGGITANSQFEKEYQELLDKIYVPIY